MNQICNIKYCSNKSCLENDECVKKSLRRIVKAQIAKMFPAAKMLPVKALIRSRPLSQKERIIYSKTQGKCWLCNQDLPPEEFTKDHVIPKSLGGDCGIDNLLPAHQKCNSLKSSRIIRSSEEFLQLFKHKL